MKHFPLFFNLENKPVLICGGNHHAFQKIQKLMPFGPEITVVSGNISEEISDVSEVYSNINIIERHFIPEDLDIHPVLVIVTEPVEITRRIYNVCSEKHIPVNAVDMPEYCDVIFPSVVSRENLCIGISSGGISPTATVDLKEKIDGELPSNIDEILEWMPRAREKVKSEVNESQKKRVLRMIYKRAAELDRPLDNAEVQKIIENTEPGS